MASSRSRLDPQLAVAGLHRLAGRAVAGSATKVVARQSSPRGFGQAALAHGGRPPGEFGLPGGPLRPPAGRRGQLWQDCACFVTKIWRQGVSILARGNSGPGLSRRPNWRQRSDRGDAQNCYGRSSARLGSRRTAVRDLWRCLRWSRDSVLQHRLPHSGSVSPRVTTAANRRLDAGCTGARLPRLPNRGERT